MKVILILILLIINISAFAADNARKPVLSMKLNGDRKKYISCSISLDLLSKTEIKASNNLLEFTGKAISTLKVKGFPDFSKDLSGYNKRFT